MGFRVDIYCCSTGRPLLYVSKWPVLYAKRGGFLHGEDAVSVLVTASIGSAVRNFASRCSYKQRRLAPERTSATLLRGTGRPLNLFYPESGKSPRPGFCKLLRAAKIGYDSATDASPRVVELAHSAVVVGRRSPFYRPPIQSRDGRAVLIGVIWLKRDKCDLVKKLAPRRP